MQISLVQRIYIHLVKKTGDLESMIERSWRNFFLSSNPNWLRIILFLGIFPKFVMKSKSITSSLERFLDRFERFLRSLRIVEMLRFPSFLPAGRAFFGCATHAGCSAQVGGRLDRCIFDISIKLICHARGTMRYQSGRSFPAIRHGPRICST